MTPLQKQFGDIDIYLFDQLLRGRIAPGMKILDAGCGGGRNLVFFLQEGYEVFGCDLDPQAIAETRSMAASLAPHHSPENFRLEAVERLSFPDSFADVVLSSAVLHFARDDSHFQAMVSAMWRVLKPGGILFCRLASKVALRHKRVKGRRYISPDGMERFLVDEEYLVKLTRRLGGQLVDPIKTTVIQDQRCMTTWVVQKRLGPDIP